MRGLVVSLVLVLVGCGSKSISGDASVDDAGEVEAECEMGELVCEGENVVDCGEVLEWCNGGRGYVCMGGECVTGCDVQEELGNNLGCEFWAVDLDNAMIGMGLDASSQQFAVVVVNPGEEEVSVHISWNIAGYGEEPEIIHMEETVVAGGEMGTYPLPRSEVDGSVDPDDGTGTALTAKAINIASTGLVAVYQFNPLEEEDVFANDASMLVPAHAYGTRYVVAGWPQTIADTEDPDTDMENDLRAFVAVVAQEDGTGVRVEIGSDAVAVLGDGDTIEPMGPGDVLEVVLERYDVLNLETDGFNADFTGTVVEADGPVAVFSGSEASDVPAYESLTFRYCCGDHLEEQLVGEGVQGTRFVAGLTHMRTTAVLDAGGSVTLPEEGEAEYFRVVGHLDDTHVTTTLPYPYDEAYVGPGELWTLEATRDFEIVADRHISVGQFVASQDRAGISHALPGGDPTFILVPGVDQWRRTYVFATPDVYAFDFLTIMHPMGAAILMDGEELSHDCEEQEVEGADWAVTECQLSFPEIDETGSTVPYEVLDGEQDDGVHVIEADVPVGVVVYGFDVYVSYGYPAGMDF